MRRSNELEQVTIGRFGACSQDDEALTLLVRDVRLVIDNEVLQRSLWVRSREDSCAALKQSATVDLFKDLKVGHDYLLASGIVILAKPG
jgi:hypothetical protein